MPLALARFSPVNATARVEPPPINETDLDRILKLVPTEILTLYTAAVPLLSHISWPWFSLALFIFGLILVPLVLYLDGRNTGQPADWRQYVIRTLTYVAWTMAVSWPLSPWINNFDVNWGRSLAVVIVPLAGALLIRDGHPPATKLPA